MKQLHFTRNGADMQVASQGNRRFVIHTVRDMPELYLAKVFEREGRRREPIASAYFDTRAKAIDWLSRYRVEKAS